MKCDLHPSCDVSAAPRSACLTFIRGGEDILCGRLLKSETGGHCGLDVEMLFWDGVKGQRDVGPLASRTELVQWTDSLVPPMRTLLAPPTLLQAIDGHENVSEYKQQDKGLTDSSEDILSSANR